MKIFRGKNVLPEVCMFLSVEGLKTMIGVQFFFFFFYISILVESLSVCIIRDSQLHDMGTSDGVSAVMAGGCSIPIA